MCRLPERQAGGGHTGGYLPFSLDITDDMGDSCELLVRVQDFSDSSYYSRGKQKLENGGMFYTAQSGIWQTVWLELVPQNHIRSVRFIPDYDNACCRILVSTSGGSPRCADPLRHTPGNRDATHAAGTIPLFPPPLMPPSSRVF